MKDSYGTAHKRLLHPGYCLEVNGRLMEGGRLKGGRLLEVLLNFLNQLNAKKMAEDSKKNAYSGRM